MTTCLGIRNATLWADARSTERLAFNCVLSELQFTLQFFID